MHFKSIFPNPDSIFPRQLNKSVWTILNQLKKIDQKSSYDTIWMKWFPQEATFAVVIFLLSQWAFTCRMYTNFRCGFAIPNLHHLSSATPGNIHAAGHPLEYETVRSSCDNSNFQKLENSGHDLEPRSKSQMPIWAKPTYGVLAQQYQSNIVLV